MSFTLRYLGTTVAEAKTYAQEVLTPQVFLQIFDMDRDGAVSGADETAFAATVERTETEFDETLAASHGAPFDVSTLAASTLRSIRQIIAEGLPWNAVKLRASMADEKKAPYRVLWKDAQDRARRIRTDDGRRLPGASTPQPTPRAGVITGDDGDAGTTWQNIASGVVSV